MQSGASVVQGLVKKLGQLVITERRRKPMKKHSAGTVRFPLKQQRINPAKMIGYRWVPANRSIQRFSLL